mmetsp:Transcript_109094/g.336769  ORF Transcript_109094/g.336769 Transcript_109094/m.336769 type:complete len:450 (+) Transcript_109094:2-1351(+)
MSRTRNLIAENLGYEPLTMGEAARILGGNRVAAAIYGIVYGFAFLGQSSYLLVLGQTLQGVLYEYEVCLSTAVLASCGICLPFLISVRDLAESVRLCLINLLLILAVLGIVMFQQAQNGRHEGVRTFLFAEDLTVFTAFGAMTNVLFSYTGHWLYFELMSEMREPEHFPRVFRINAPVQVGLYMLVACWGYYYAGDTAAGYFLDNLPNGFAYRCASALLFVHVIVSFLIKNVVLVRYLHSLVSPSRAARRWPEPGGARAHAEYVCLAVLMLMSCFFVANAIPFFMEFLGLIGGFLSGPISFLLPVVFYVMARRQSAAPEAPETPSTCASALDPDAKAEIGSLDPAIAHLVYGDQVDLVCPNSSLPDEAALSKPLLDVACAKGESGQHSRGPTSARSLPWLDVALFVVVGAVTLPTMVVGTYDVLSRIAANWDEQGPLFSCRVLPPDRVR